MLHYKQFESQIWSSGFDSKSAAQLILLEKKLSMKAVQYVVEVVESRSY